MATPNLWEQAAATLRPNEQLPIDLNDPTMSNSVNDVLQYANNKRDECIKRGWKYKKKNGEEVQIRDIFSRIVVWVNKFKEVGDTLVQYDPGHAALPWAAVRFVLQVAVSEDQTFGAMADGLELVAKLITRSKVVEELYLLKLSSMNSQLKDALLALYSAILIYLSKAGGYYKQSTAERLLKSALPMRSPEKYINPILAGQALVESCTNMMDSEAIDDINSEVQIVRKTVETSFKNVMHTLGQLDGSLSETAAHVSDLYQALKDDERERLLTWLSVAQPWTHHRANIALLSAGSCSWLFQKEAFKIWAESCRPSVLWLHGIPGCGKSMLTCSVIQNRKEIKSPLGISAPLIAYFYCSRDTAEPERSDPAHILRSVVEQLSCSSVGSPIRQPTLRAFFQRKLESQGRQLEPLTLDECTELVLELLEEKPAYIIIDALDECDPMRRQDLLVALERISRESIFYVKIFISSRDDTDIARRLATSSELYVQVEDNSKDIEDFTKIQVEKAISEGRILNGDISLTIKSEIIATLNAKAGGMFKLVSSHLQSLSDRRRIKTEENIRSALNALPKELHKTYAIILDQISAQERPNPEIAFTAIKWLMCAQRRLEAKEFLSAIAVDPRGHPHTLGKTSLLDICCNLVVYEPLQNVFRLAHLSVREYFETNLGWNSSISNALATERCLDVLWSLAGSKLSATTKTHNHQLYQYANSYWSHHYRSSMSSDLDQQLLRGKLKFFWSTPCREDSCFTKWLVSATTHDDDCHFKGFNEFKSSLLDFISLFQWAGVLERNKNQCANLSGRLTNGDLAHMLVHLLRKRLDFASALQCSVVAENEYLVRLFIKAGDQLNVPNLEGDTALALAIRQECPGIAHLLLKNGATVSPESTALSLGIMHGSPELVNLLLEEGLIDNTSFCKNNLHPRRIVEIYQELQTLCRPPVNTDLQTGLEESPTTEALSCSRIQSISRCIGYLGYEHFQERPRTYAILHMMRSTNLMHHFVSEGLLDDSLPYLDGRSLPHALRSDPGACRQFFELQMHAIPPAQTPALIYDEPLYREDPYACAIPGSFPESPKFFEIATSTTLPDGPNTRVTQSGDRTSQVDKHYSVHNGSAEIDESLDTIMGASGDSTHAEGVVNSLQAPRGELELHPLLDNASELPQITLEAINKYLEEVHDQMADTDSMAKFIFGSKKFNPAGLMLPSQDRTNFYLETYCKQGKSSAVRLLLDSGCNPGTKKDPRPGPIFNTVQGATSRHTKCLRELIKYGVNVNVRARRSGRTPLMVAVKQFSWSGYSRVVYLLLKAGANPDAQDAAGDVALSQLFFGGSDPLDGERQKALALLLHSSYNTNADRIIPATHSTPLHLAILRNDPWAVGMLLQRNVSIETKNVFGNTPLQVATTLWSPTITSSQLSILDLLIEKGARANVCMEDNDKTPLHIAVSYGLTRVAEKLLSSGAEPRLRTRDGKTVHDLADERKNQHECKDCQDCSTMREVLLKGYGYSDLKLAEYACFWGTG